MLKCTRTDPLPYSVLRTDVKFLLCPFIFFFTASQIYIFYGTRSNAEFVIHSGFFFDNNSHDRVKIKLGVSKSDRLYAMKAEVLARAGIPTYVETGQLFPVLLEMLTAA